MTHKIFVVFPGAIHRQGAHLAAQSSGVADRRRSQQVRAARGGEGTQAAPPQLAVFYRGESGVD